MFVLLLFIPFASTEFLELCCTFTESTTREVKTLNAMVESVDHKVIMGCSKKPEKRCACFESTWDCPKLTVTRLKSGESFEVENGQVATVFHNIMRQVYPSSKAEKEGRSVHFCGGAIGTPFIWSLVALSGMPWSYKKYCFSSQNVYEIKLDSQTSIGVSMVDTPLKFLLASYGNVAADSFDRETASVVIGLETTSEGSFDKLSTTITRGYPAVEVIKEDITKDASVRREEVVMSYQGVRCRSFNYQSCMDIFQLYNLGQDENSVFHLGADLLDLFLTTSTSPVALIIYKAGNFEEAQGAVMHLSASLGQSTLNNYTVGLMEETSKYGAGIYYSLLPNNLMICKEELYKCFSTQFGVYLPHVSREHKIRSFSRVFGEQHLNRENEHRGNLNNPWYFEPPPELLELTEIRNKLQRATREPLLTSPTTSLTVLNELSYKRVLKGDTGTFILFVFRSDVGSLYTLQEILSTNLTGLQVVECFNLNLVCQKLSISTYPVVKYVRKGEVLPYEGAIDERSMKVFRELVNHPVVTPSHRIQVDLVLKDPDYRAAVMLSGRGDKKREDLFHLACDALYGSVRCYLLSTPPTSDTGTVEDTIIVHVPKDPVMINKKFTIPSDPSLDGLVEKIKKLALASVISEHQLLLAYRDLTDIVLFEATVDDALARTISHFPGIQFVQVSSVEFKHELLQQLIGYDYENAMLYISKTRNVGFRFREGATLETWLTGILDGSLDPDFKLKDLQGSKFQFHDIFYKSQFRNFEGSVREMRDKIDRLNANIGKSAWGTSHQEL